MEGGLGIPRPFKGNFTDSDHFFAFLHQKFSKGVEEEVMSLGQRAIQQAVQQAVQQATQRADLQATRRTALRMLEEKCDIQFISRITHLSLEEINQLAVFGSVPTE